MTEDLPELSERDLADLELLTPDSVAAPPACVPDDLDCGKLEMIRDWLHAMMASDVSLLRVVPLDTEVLDQSISSIVADHRRVGIDLKSRRDLLVTYFGLQLNLIMVQRDWSFCGDVHTYLHFARPYSNLALAYELLLFEVFGEDAAYYPEGGE